MKPRLLVNEDYHKGFLDLLNQLTPVKIHPPYHEFCTRLQEMQKHNSFVYVIEKHNQIIATGKVIIELKFHNGFASMGHIEDVVVDKLYRGNRYGQSIVKVLLDKAEKGNCYKIVLDCSTKNIAFYQKCGMKQKGNEMVKYFI